MLSRLALRLRLGGTRRDTGRLVVYTGWDTALVLSADSALATGLGRAGEGRSVVGLVRLISDGRCLNVIPRDVRLIVLLLDFCGRVGASASTGDVTPLRFPLLLLAA
jgi:hypothetical protein